MDKFEKQFDDLAITSEYMENSMAQSSALTTPEDDVNSLMAAIADEHGLEMSSQVQIGNAALKHDPLSVQQDELSSRLAKLKQQQM